MKNSKKTKRFLSAALALITIFVSMLSVNTAFAADDNSTTTKKVLYHTIFNVDNYTVNGNVATNFGGISVGTTNNRLYCIKSNSDEEHCSLYYYSNMFENKPIRIKFYDSLLGHANSMAIDNKYIYVSMWQRTHDEKNKIIRISRQAIRLMYDGFVVSNKVNSIKGEKIYTVFDPVNEDGSEYTGNISALTRYKYDSDSGDVVFLINAGTGVSKEKLTYRTMKLSSGKLVVQSKKYNVYNPAHQYKDGSERSCTMQDFYYSKSYGLFIPIWHDEEMLWNSILQVNLSRPETEFTMILNNDGKTYYTKETSKLTDDDKENIKTRMDGKPRTFKAIKPTYVYRMAANSKNFNKFELESLSFVTKSEDKKSDDFRIIMSCNKFDKNDKGCDAIVEIQNAKTEVVKLS